MGLIRDIDTSQERRTIVGGVVRVLRDFGRTVIADGAETAAELAAIRALGITLVQGFYLGRPSRIELQRRPDNIASAAR